MSVNTFQNGETMIYVKSRKSRSQPGKWLAWAALEPLTADDPVTEPADPVWFHIADSEQEAIDHVRNEAAGACTCPAGDFTAGWDPTCPVHTLSETAGMIRWIDHASYEDLLTKHRFEEVDSPWFTGDVGKHCRKVMAEKRLEIGEDGHTAASKAIGWYAHQSCLDR